MERYGYLPPDKRKKILLLSDDLRMPSGVGVMSREMVVGTIQHYHWIQVAAAVVHPEAGKMMDASVSLSEDTGVDGTVLRLFPYNGYGDIQLIRYLMKTEKPDAIMLFTDPRYFIWLFQMEHELRQQIPILYYNIWDDLPYPKYNKQYYQSVDALFAISRQTYNINKQVLGEDRDNIAIKYIPHGINPKQFFPLTDSPEHQALKDEMRKKLFGEDEVEFVVLYNNRNIRRKMTGDVVLAYRDFVLKLPEEQQKKCRLVLHTQPIDDNGTDLYALVRDVASDVPIVFSVDRLDTDKLNVLYNISDAVINLASNEGFGLGTCEALMAGTMIVVNVTGGLQDQCGFRDSKEGELLHEDKHYCYEWGSNHDGKYLWHGEWACAVFPVQRALIGSPPTPYIFDDRCRWEDAALALKFIHSLTPEERKRRGLLGHEYVMTQGYNAPEMNKRFIDSIDEVMHNWRPRRKFELVKA